MPPERLYDELTTKSIELNLGIVNQVYLNELEPTKIDGENSQVIELRALNTTLPTIHKKLKASPLLRGISDSITKGDLVLFCQINRKTFYIGPLNTFNQPNVSPNHFYSDEQTNRGVVELEITNEFGYGNEYPLNKVRKLSKSTKPLLDRFSRGGYNSSKYSDLTLEGRHGNAIRIGSRSINPILNISNNNLGSEESLLEGSLISMLSNGSLSQNFNNINFRLSVDTVTEDVNNYTINGGNDQTENFFNYNYSQEIIDETEKIDFDQIIIFSDRITFDARSRNAGDFTVSANNNINFGARKNFTLNNSGYSVINSGNIYLGKEAKNRTEPMVLGNQLKELLISIVEILRDSRALVQGVPVPLVRQDSSPILTQVEAILGNLNNEYKPEVNIEDPNNPNPIADRSIGGPSFFSNHYFIEPNRPNETQENV